MNWRKSVILKKAVRFGYNTLRNPSNWLADETDFERRPPIIANSFPKSGTHLLIQILQAVPGIRDWGFFLASTPSFTFREIPVNKMARKISNIAPGELVGAHLFYSEKVGKALDDKQTIQYFIYRDPRDVVVSEAHYLTHMNKWHKLHKYFKALPGMNSRLLFSINGASEPDFPYDYPNIADRFSKYKNWLSNAGGHSIKFEDLIGPNYKETIRKILQFYVRKSGNSLRLEDLVQQAIANINPERSHTFRQGKVAAWKEVFTKEHKDAFKECAGQLLIDLGYEQDENW